MFIKRPNKIRRTFALIGDDGKTIDDLRVRAINTDLFKGASLDILEARMKSILSSYKEEQPTRLLALSNQKIIKEIDIRKRRKKPWLASHSSLNNNLIWAIEKIGNVSIADASEEELYASVDRITKPASRFEVIRAINELLIFCRRPFKLVNQTRPHIDEVSHITFEYFREREHLLLPTHRLYLGALFATGCRFGELPRAQITPISVWIASQIRKNGIVSVIKNKKQHTALLVPGLEPYALEFNELTYEQKVDLRINHYNKLYGACRRILGINIHALRHSYCIEMLKGGFNDFQVAGFIGDIVEVVNKHYGAYIKKDDEMARLRAAWKGR